MAALFGQSSTASLDGIWEFDIDALGDRNVHRFMLQVSGTNLTTCNRYLAALKATYSMAIRNRKASAPEGKQQEGKVVNSRGRDSTIRSASQGMAFLGSGGTPHRIETRGTASSEMGRFEFSTAPFDSARIQGRGTKTSANERRCL
jgi:hypothetical protein